MPVRPNNLGNSRAKPAVVAADKEWGFFCMCVFVFNYRLLSLPFRSSALDID